MKKWSNCSTRILGHCWVGWAFRLFPVFSSQEAALPLWMHCKACPAAKTLAPMNFKRFLGEKNSEIWWHFDSRSQGPIKRNLETPIFTSGRTPQPLEISVEPWNTFVCQGAERPLRREVTTCGSADRKLAEALDTPTGPHQFDHFPAVSSGKANFKNHPQNQHTWVAFEPCPNGRFMALGCPHDLLHLWRNMNDKYSPVWLMKSDHLYPSEYFKDGDAELSRTHERCQKPMLKLQSSTKANLYVPRSKHGIMGGYGQTVTAFPYDPIWVVILRLLTPLGRFSQFHRSRDLPSNQTWLAGKSLLFDDFPLP